MTDPTPAEALKACPFCGKDATVIITDARPCEIPGWSDAFSVWCRDSVKCSGRLSRLYQTRDAAITAWNTRPPAADAGEDVAAYIRALSPEHFAAMMQVAAGRQDYPGSDAGEVREKVAALAEALVKGTRLDISYDEAVDAAEMAIAALPQAPSPTFEDGVLATPSRIEGGEVDPDWDYDTMDIEMLRRLVRWRDRQIVTINGLWAIFGKKALAGDPQALRNRIDEVEAPAAAIRKLGS